MNNEDSRAARAAIRSDKDKSIRSDQESLTGLLPEIHDLILRYSKPLETPHLILVLNDNTKKWKTRQEWIASRRIYIYNPNDRILRESRVDGILHRLSSEEHEAAEVCVAGVRRWFYNNQLHRDNDLPAYVDGDKSEHWYRHGASHRDNDKPALIMHKGYAIFHPWHGRAIHAVKHWWFKGKCFRANNKPVIEDDKGTFFWCRDDFSFSTRPLDSLLVRTDVLTCTKDEERKIKL